MPAEIARGLPVVAVVAIALAGGAAAVWLARRQRLLAPRPVARLLAGLRGALVVLLALLLADVAIVRTRERSERPDLLIAIDGSRSMTLEAASGMPGSRIDAVRDALRGPTGDGERLLDALPRRFSIVPIWLGDRLQELTTGDGGELALPSPDAGRTDLARPIVEAVTARRHQRLRAVVLFSDGGHNADGRPGEVIGALEARGVPLFTVGVGPSRRPPDLRIARLEGPDGVYRGDRARLALALESVGLQSLTGSLEVRDGDDLLVHRAIEIPSSGDRVVETPVELEVTLDRPGRRKLTVSVAGTDGDAIPANNTRDIWIDVLEEKIRVLLLDGGPRWEFRYLRSALERDTNVEASALLVTRPPDRRLPPGYPRRREDLFAFDVVVLGDVERAVFTETELDALRDFVVTRGGSIVLVAGDLGMPTTYANTPLEEVIPVVLRSPPPAPGTGSVREGFRPALTAEGERSAMLRLDADRERNRTLWSLLPALHWAYPHDGVRPGARTLAVRAGATGRESRDALLVARELGAGKVLFCGTDETWAWRFRIGDELFERHWSRVIRWAASGRLPPGDGLVRIGTDRARYEAPAGVSVRALVLDGEGRPVGGPDARVDVEITDVGTGRVRRVRLEPIAESGGLFRGTLTTGSGDGALSPGEYRIAAASPSLPGYAERAERTSARFVVDERPSTELDTPVRDEAFLAGLAAGAAPGGRFLPIERAGELVDLVDGEPVRFEERVVIDQWSFAWPLLCLLALLPLVEWALGKRHGLP